MNLTDLLSRAAERGVRLSVEGDRLSVRAPKGALTPELQRELGAAKAEILALLRGGSSGAPTAGLVPDPEHRHDPFPLTDIQRAYWLGRSGDFELSMPCQVVFEVEAPDLDLPRLVRAWDQVLARHEMLRAVVLPDGTQRVLERPPPWEPRELDLRDLDEAAAADALDRQRHAVLRRAQPADQWPLFELWVVLLPAGRRLIQYRVELSTMDARSIMLLQGDLFAAYRGATLPPPPAVSFRDVVLAQVQDEASPATARDRDYWQERLPRIAPAPELPLAVHPGSVSQVTMRRDDVLLDRGTWGRLRARAAAEGLTEGALLCAAWAELLAAWSRTRPFSINLTTFNRPDLHPEILGVIGDFTSTLVLSVERDAPTFLGRAREVRDQLSRDLEHGRYSGVRVVRDLNRARGGGAGASMPIVLTVLLGGRSGVRAMLPPGWRVSWGLSQTPQVWLDHQIYEDDDGVHFQWDTVSELLPPPTVAAMQAAWRGLLVRLADDPSAWEAEDLALTPPGDLAAWARLNDTGPGSPPRLLHAPLEVVAATAPDSPALIAGDRVVSHHDLHAAAASLAEELRQHGPGPLVGICLEKGPAQAVAALAVLRCGAAYVPLDPAWPEARRQAMLESAGVHVIIGQGGLELRLGDASAPPPPAPDRLAYVIYTSGSTGTPKGVMIRHAAAANTLDDLERRLELGPSDRVLAVSSLSFDLSVWDLFGVLGAGGAVVYPSADRDPAAWARDLATHGVTVWNSVPSLFAMLVDHLASAGQALPPSLRLVLLSGDWIPVDLPERARRLSPGLRIISMGGATEASIWSVLYEIGQVDPTWPSVPYGRPMLGQTMSVRDERMALRPVGVPGDLWIGGVGLADGYLGDPERTATRFPTHRGERLYRTGDLARLLPDGVLEFLGRQDAQVKIRGHRVELGEIEAALIRHPEVEQAVATVFGDPRGHRRLAAYVVPRPSAAPCTPWTSLLEAARRGADEPLPEGSFSEARGRRVERAACHAIAAGLATLGAFQAVGEPWTPETLMSRCGIQPFARRWLRRALDQLTDAGLLERRGEAWAAPRPISAYAERTRATRILDEEGGEVAALAQVRAATELLPRVLSGEIPPTELMFREGEARSAELAYEGPLVYQSHRALAAAAGAWLAGRDPARPVRVLEIGAGVGGATRHLLPVLPPERTRYAYTDISAYFLKDARERFGGWAGLVPAHFDLDGDPLAQGFPPGSVDLLVASSALHVARDLRAALARLAPLLAPGGALLLVEETRLGPLLSLSMGLLPDLDRFEDLDLRPLSPTVTADRWLTLLGEAGFGEVAVVPPGDGLAREIGVVALLASAGPGAVDAALGDTLRAWLATSLPEVMVPTWILPIPALPLSANGKVDRRALPSPERAEHDAGASDEGPRTELERAVAALWRDLLGVPKVGRKDGFFALGGDSLLGARLLARLRAELGLDLSLRALLEDPTVAGIAARSTAQSAEEPAVTLVHDAAGRHAPFPLTPLQEAYMVGRGSALEMGSVAGHIYMELAIPDLDLPRMERAWNQLIARHDMLRMVIDADGLQRVLPEVPTYRIEVGADAMALRERMSHQVLPVDRWPLFEIKASRPEGGWHVHLSLDTLLGDAYAFRTLFGELAAIYADPQLVLPQPPIQFRDVVLAMRALKEGPRYAEDLAWWRERLPTLPAAPALPLARDPSTLGAPRFVRRMVSLDRAAWAALLGHAARHELTPTTVLLAIYTEILSRWSGGGAFTLNVPTFNRPPLHPAINDIVGDFASFLLLPVDALDDRPFAARAMQLQRRAWEMLDHDRVHGVDLLRELARSRSDLARNAFPVVYTSAVSLRAVGRPEASPELFGQRVFSITQTPQVMMDFQVFETDGALSCQWDAVDALFPPGLVDTMVGALDGLLRRLASDGATWEAPLGDLIPAEQRARRPQLPPGPYPAELPQEGFLRHAAADSAAIAVISPERTLTRGELDALAWRLAHALRASGVGPERRVPVLLRKGWRQVVSAHAILRAGGAMMPLDPASPPARLAELLAVASAPALLGAAEAAELSLPVDQAHLLVEEEALAAWPTTPFPAPQRPDDLAYVLFTSGSTGRPKGVMLEGRGLSLALGDTAERFQVGPTDRVFGITALHHDMSLWDVFGVLGAGGSLLLPSADDLRDPAAWAALLDKHGVTLWNSVPAFLTMLLEHVAAGHPLALPGLRWAFVGGDWIPLTQPAALRALAPAATLVSVGGPTETTLWNIWHPVEEVDPAWKSVPYGRPIPHAAYRVLGEGGHELPDLVPGELVAVGPGVTRGYLDDPERTAERLGRDAATGQRTWRTGDQGRFLPDGNLEFLGRKDRMLKVLGQRIEPGEVEAALRAHPEVVDAVVDAPLEGGQRRRLVAWVVLRNTMLQLDDLRIWLAGRLPPPLVPGLILPIEALPLSANGKVDRSRLRLPEAASATTSAPTAGLGRVLAIVEEVLGQRGITADTDLIALGANSIDLLRLSNRVEAEFGVRPSPTALFRAPTVRGLMSTIGPSGAPDEDRAPGALREKLSAYRIIADPAGRDAFRRRGLGVRPEVGRPRHPLPGDDRSPAALARYAARKSVRSFSLRPVPEASLGQLLAVLRRITLEDRPRYLYPSGGGLYPLQVYLHARPGRITGIEAGTWYYQPDEHALVPVRLGPDIPRGVHAPFINQPIYDEAAFSLFFVCDLDAIGPLYGGDSVHIATLEAGIVGQLLDVESREIGLGLCHIGRLNFEEIRPLFQLSDSQILIHSMLGGLPADGPSPAGADDSTRASRLLDRVKQLGPDEVRALLAARRAAGGKT